MEHHDTVLYYLLEERDSNPRTLARTDLQSVGFNHSPTFQCELPIGLEPITLRP
jgi:hypothetical protein